MAEELSIQEISTSSSPPKPGRVKEYYRYPFMEAYSKGRVRRYFADDLYKMVNDPSTDSIVSWSQDGKSFIFWDQDKFCNDVLPKYGHSTSPSFIGRLHRIYHFRKVEESEHAEYAHDYFVRGKPELTVEIERQFKEKLAPIKFDIPPLEPGYKEKPGFKEKRDRLRALVMAKKAARRLSLKE